MGTAIGVIEGVGPVTAEALRAFEALLGCRLPPEYRSFLRAHNGGVPEPSSFRPLDGDEAGASGVETFFFLTDEGTSWTPGGTWMRGTSGARVWR